MANVVGQLYNATDTVMIGMIPALATTGVAVYNVGGTFNSIMSSLTTGVSGLLAPKVNKMVFQGASGEELTDLAVRVGRIQGYIMMLIVSGFIAFGKPFITFYVGQEYMRSYWVAILIMVPNMIPLVQSICLNIVVAQNKHRFRSIVYLIMAVSNVIGTWYMMQCLGVIGAALMSGIALTIGNGFIMNWYYQRYAGIDVIRFWKDVGCILIAPCLMCMTTVALSAVINFYSIVALVLGIILYTTIYCLINWRFVMNDYEKRVIRELVSAVIRPIYRHKS